MLYDKVELLVQSPYVGDFGNVEPPVCKGELHQDGGLVLLNLHYGLHEVTLSLFQRLCVCVCVCARARA